MSSILLLLISTVGLAGVFFNVRMLMLTRVKNKSKYTSLQKFRPFIICQFICQVTILATTTIEAWIGLDAEKEEFQCVLKMLTISMKILLVCNMVAISAMLAPDHPRVSKLRLLATLVAAAVFFGLISETMLWWHNYEFVPHRVILIVLADFLLLLLLTSMVSFQLYPDKTNGVIPTSLCDIWIRNTETLMLASVWLLLCCGVMIALRALLCIFFKVLGEQNVSYLYAFLVNSADGIMLPLALVGSLNLRCEEENEIKTVVTKV